MPSIKGVAAYVAKTYKRREAARLELLYAMHAAMDEREDSQISARMRVIREMLQNVENLSSELGSMRRLLGDLKMDEEASTRP